MGGFYTYQELLDILDVMATLYPNLITTKQQISDTLTHEGRPIYWVKISDNPTVDENEPEVFYNALIHAREPGSLSQLIFYMWHLLEGYGNNDEVTYLVDNIEMYFVPCANPDGYIYNETTDPNGGGLWRLNRRDNGDGTFGVDLNRNFGFEWGYDDFGSSPITGSLSYRGPAPFSEPETQNIKAFCEAHEFIFVQNVHSFGNLLIYPWGYDLSLGPADPLFESHSEAFTRDNDFVAGTALNTVGYPVNGVADDWMYGEDSTKNAIYSYTPEVGSSDYFFWPPASEIENLGKSMLVQNLTMAHLPLNFALVKELDGDIITDIFSDFHFELNHYGLQDGNISLSFSPATNNFSLSTTSMNYTMVAGEIILDSVGIGLGAVVQNGDEIGIAIAIDNGLYVHHDTIYKTYRSNTISPVFTDAGDDLTAWQNTGNSAWGVTPLAYYTAPTSFTDSPLGNYGSDANTVLSLQNSINLSQATYAKLQFRTKWEIENNFDYGQVRASSDGINYEPLCGKYTKIGGQSQDPGEPVYEGQENQWVLEEMDLSDFLGGGFIPAICLNF